MTALSAFRLPNIDVPDLDRPELRLPDALAKVDLPAVDLPQIDLRGALSDAAAAVHLGGRRRRPRWPFAIGGLIVAGVAGWTIMQNQQVRTSLRDMANSIRERISAMRSTAFDLSTIDDADPIAFPAAETKPIAPDPWTDGENVDTPDYPDGLGSNNGDGMPIKEESESRA